MKTIQKTTQVLRRSHHTASLGAAFRNEDSVIAMDRTREFDPTDALDGAMHAFWSNGF